MIGRTAASASHDDMRTGGHGGRQTGGTRGRSLRNQIRGVQRMLLRTLSPGVREAQEEKLAELQRRLAKADQSSKERKLVLRYRRVRFTERVKVSRRLSKAERAIRLAEKTGDAAAMLKARRALQQAREDLEYVTHFPKDEKYVSLLVNPNDEAGIARVESERTRLRAKVKEELAAQAADRTGADLRGMQDTDRTALALGTPGTVPAGRAPALRLPDSRVSVPRAADGHGCGDGSEASLCSANSDAAVGVSWPSVGMRFSDVGQGVRCGAANANIQAAVHPDDVENLDQRISSGRGSDGPDEFFADYTKSASKGEDVLCASGDNACAECVVEPPDRHVQDGNAFRERKVDAHSKTEIRHSAKVTKSAMSRHNSMPRVGKKSAGATKSGQAKHRLEALPFKQPGLRNCQRGGFAVGQVSGEQKVQTGLPLRRRAEGGRKRQKRK